MSISVKDQFLKLKLKIGIQTKRQRLSQKHLKDSEVTVTQLQVRWTYFHVQSSPLCLDVNTYYQLKILTLLTSCRCYALFNDLKDLARSKITQNVNSLNSPYTNKK